MPSKPQKPSGKVRLGRATGSEIVSSLRISPREIRRAEAAVAAAMGSGKGTRSSRKTVSSRAEK